MFKIDPDGDIFPETHPDLGSKILKGFIWRGEERILTKDGIFDEDDNNIVLPIIRGISNPIDIDAEEEERSSNENDPVNNIPPEKDRVTDPKKNPKPKKV